MALYLLVGLTLDNDLAIGSELSGNFVTIVAGQDFSVRGSNVIGSEGLTVMAGRDIDISGAENYENSFFREVIKKSGFSGGFSGGGFSVGYTRTEQGEQTATQALYHTASLVGSETGDVTLYAGRDAFVRGSHVVAGTGDLFISGREVTIENQFDTYDSQSRQWFEQKGLTLSVGLSGAGSALGSAISQGLTLADQYKLAKNAQTDLAAALYGMAAARSAYDLYQGLPAVGKELGGILGQGGGSGLGFSIGLGYSQSKSESKFQSHDEVAVGSSITSGGDAFIVARGDEDGRGGNLNIIGSRVDAGGTVTLAANHDLILRSAEEVSSYKSENKSSNSGLGVSYGVGVGLGINASYGQSKGNGSGNTVTHLETIVNGWEGVNFISGNDTTLKGAQIWGGQVTGRVGGNLTIISEQDTSRENQSQKTSGGGLSLGGAGNSLSYNNQNQKAKGDYASVNEQSGIFAGQGGFDIEVGGHTGMVGAVITGEAPVDKNTLTTASLTVQDIENHSDYSAETKGWGVEIGDGKGSLSPSLPMEDSGSDSSVTRSAIDEGTINITDEARQKELTGQNTDDYVAALNRDTANAHQGPLDHNPDLGEILSKQAEIVDAAGQAGPAIAKTTGDIAERMYATTGDAGWQEGGVYKTLLQAAGAAIVAQIGNGEGLEAVLGAAASQLAAGKIYGFASEVAQNITDNPVKQALIANLISNAISGAIGYVSGEETGANAASIFNRFNGQIHPDVLNEIEKIAADSSSEKRLIAAACALVNCYIEYDQDDPRRKIWEEIFRYGSSDELKNERKILKDSGIIMYTSYAAALDGLKELGLISGAYAGARMLGTYGAQVISQTVYTSLQGRLDIENPAPGKRAGQIHFHDADGKKYLYDPSAKSFVGAPKHVNKLLSDPDFMNSINKAMKILGEIK